MKKGKDRRNKASKDKLLKIVLRAAIFLVIIAVMAFPFILDTLYGKGLLKPVFENSFSADTWFSFIGSYFPAAILGCLTLYQAFIIQYQEKRYRRLLSRHQFAPSCRARIYRYDDSQNKIGDWAFYQVKQMLTQCQKDNLCHDWNKGYILECGIFDLQGVGIDTVKIKELIWEINGRFFRQKNSGQMANATERVSRDEYKLMFFWKFADRDAAADEITECMLYGVRQSPHYAASRVTLGLQLIDDLGDSYNVRTEFEMRAGQTDVYSLYSVKEKNIAVRGKE